MRRALLFAFVWMGNAAVASPLSAQQSVPEVSGPLWWRAFVFVMSLPYTLFMIFTEGQRLYLLPAPLLGAVVCVISFLEWRRQRFWTPRLVHVMAVLALAVIIAINVAWVMAGGEMWLQRYVIIAVFGLFPYVAYLLFLGPKYIGRRHTEPESGTLMSAGPSGRPTWMADHVPIRRRGLVWSYAVVGVVVLMVIGVAGVSLGVGTTPRAISESVPEMAGLRDPGAMMASARGVSRGDPSASLTIVEFGDYECPACGAFARRFEPRVDSAFVDTGRARFVYIDFPLEEMHPNAFQAARAAHCAEDQGGYWEYHDELYNQQKAWSPLADPTPAFEEYAEGLGLDRGEFSACLESNRHVELVAANERLAESLRIYRTPTIVVLHDGGDARRSPEYDYQSVYITVEETLVGGVVP